MTVYLLHLRDPMDRGRSPSGTQLQAAHYLGWTQDLVGRILEHKETTWERWPEPEIHEDGSVKAGERRGTGSTFMGAANSQGIGWELARSWPDADRSWERTLKRYKNAPRLCPICSGTKALQRMQSRQTTPTNPQQTGDTE